MISLSDACSETAFNSTATPTSARLQLDQDRRAGQDLPGDLPRYPVVVQPLDRDRESDGRDPETGGLFR